MISKIIDIIKIFLKGIIEDMDEKEQLVQISKEEIYNDTNLWKGKKGNFYVKGAWIRKGRNRG